MPTFTMITRSANELMMWINNNGDNKHRRTLFVTPEMEKAWLRKDRGGKPHPEGKLKDGDYAWKAICRNLVQTPPQKQALRHLCFKSF